ncbi:hypothetical protein JW992_16375, partial [candidate division KSB1 bacterium]|nr:hypothetical protein [candidate division KSB1 bacterium]
DTGSSVENWWPTFSWTGLPDGVLYQIALSRDTLFSTPVIHYLSETCEYPSEDLSPGTYYWRVRAGDAAGNWGSWSDIWQFTIPTKPVVRDIDGNVYAVVKIGDQWWMAENLRVTHYRNGDVIPHITDDNEWANAFSDAYCTLDNDEAHALTYGHLYKWYTIFDERGLAPAGWHVPSDEEWKALEIALGMDPSETDREGWRGQDEGGKLKLPGTEYWNAPNAGATNESGFCALPGGLRSKAFSNTGDCAYFWTSSLTSWSPVWYRIVWARLLHTRNTNMCRIDCRGQEGLSVRCVRD